VVGQSTAEGELAASGGAHDERTADGELADVGERTTDEEHAGGGGAKQRQYDVKQE
jgi:hypothetical protein